MNTNTPLYPPFNPPFLTDQVPANVGSATWLAILPWLLIVVMTVAVVWLLPKFQDYALGLKPVVVDGLIVTALGGLIYSQAYFSGDDAYKYVSPPALYWLRYGFGLIAAIFLALKSYRSVDYANHLKAQKDASSGKVTETVIESHSKAIETNPPTPGKPESITP